MPRRSDAPLESTIVKGGMKIGESLGFLAVKFHGGPYFPRGFPDVGFFKGGSVRFVEYKRPGEEPSEIQKVWHKRLRDLGFEVAVIDRAADTRVFLEGLQ